MKLFIVPIIAIIAIAGLELFALTQGINGTVLALAFSAIGAIATGGTIKLWGKLKAKNLEINIGQEKQ